VLGNSKLRENILSLYTEDASFPSGAELALSITQGAISANFLVLDTLVGPGEHVICQYPTYQQLYEVPRRAGAEVSLWRTTPEQNWIPDVAELSSLVRDNTKMMIIKYEEQPTWPCLFLGVVDFRI
jgi:aspartate/methionine/tyrosine aminotransferase